MKTLKYALVFILFLCWLLLAHVNPAQSAEIYTLETILIGVSENGDDGHNPELTILLLEDGREVDIGVAEDCRFFDLSKNEQTTLDVFVERFAKKSHRLEIDFVEHKDDYLIIECRGRVMYIN